MQKLRDTRSPPCFAELWAPTPEQNPRPPREKGGKNEEKMGTKSWVLNRTAKRGSQNWVDFFKKKSISHYVFACFVQLGSKFGVLLSTRQLYIYIYIYIYICCGVIIWSKFCLLRGYYLAQVCFFNTVCQRHYKNRGFSTFVVTKKLRAQNSGVVIWSECAFLKRTQLGSDNNPYLDQIITPQTVFWYFWL